MASKLIVRRILMIGLPSLVVVCVAGVFAHGVIKRSASIGVSRDNFQRIGKGTTKDEVNSLFGNETPTDDRFGLNAEEDTKRWRWHAGPDHVVIIFDQRGCVVGKEWWTAEYNVDETIYQIIKLRPKTTSESYRLDQCFTW